MKMQPGNAGSHMPIFPYSICTNSLSFSGAGYTDAGDPMHLSSLSFPVIPLRLIRQEPWLGGRDHDDLHCEIPIRRRQVVAVVGHHLLAFSTTIHSSWRNTLQQQPPRARPHLEPR
jgi:hypothetical protein